MANIYDLAYDLEKGLRESQEFQSLKEAYDRVMNDPSAKQMFDNFRETQLDLQQNKCKVSISLKKKLKKLDKSLSLFNKMRIFQN